MPKFLIPFLNLKKKGGDILGTNSKCSETPLRKGPMTVKVDPYKRDDGTKVKGHKRHTPKK